MKSSLPNFSISDLKGSHINQLGQFEEILEQANKKGIINNPPDNEEETYDINSQRIRIQTIASRLWLLGYLPRKISCKNIHNKIDDIKNAVAQFQRDANLKQDVWVGDKTWYKLDELVSFESDFSYNKWFTNGNIKTEVSNAVHRAIQLRLWSLGLYKNRPNKNFKLLKKSDLKNFENILKIFIIKNDQFKADLNFETLKLLFNQDILTNAIAKRSSKNIKSFLLKLPVKYKEIQRKLAQKFIVNCAKIELWLLGYEVEIDGKNDFEISKESKLYVAISHYYQHFENFNKSTANKLAEKITPKLFKEIGVANKISDNYNSDDASEEIIEEINTNIDINNAWNYIENKGMRLWDGVKRLWRWFKKIGKKVVSFFKRNIYKAFFRYASKAFKIVKIGISAVVKSINVYLKGELNVTNISFQFSKDMDTTVYLSKGLSIEDAELGINKLVKQTKAFNVACRMISWIFEVFKNIATGFVGWAKLLYSLLYGYKELKRLYLDFKFIAAE